MPASIDTKSVPPNEKHSNLDVNAVVVTVLVADVVAELEAEPL